MRHGIGRRGKWLTSIPRSFCLRYVSQVPWNIFLLSAVTLVYLYFVLLFIPFFLGFFFMLSLVTAVLKELSQHLSLGSVKTCKICFLGLRSPNMTLSFPSTNFLIHRKCEFLHPVQAHQYHCATGDFACQSNPCLRLF